jgi:hypothetical protein
MKKLVLVLLMLTLFSSVAYAGIGDWLQEGAWKLALSGVVSGVFAVLSLFFGKKVSVYKNMVNEGKDCAIWIYEATRPKSPGGTTITKEELENGLKEFDEFGAQVLAVIEAHKKK